MSILSFAVATTRSWPTLKIKNIYRIQYHRILRLCSEPAQPKAENRAAPRLHTCFEPRYTNSSKAKHPDLAARFIDYLLSERGRRVAREKAFFFSRDGTLPAGVDGPPSLIESGVGRPVRIGPALLATQDEAQRKRFIDDWTDVMASKDNHTAK